MTEASKPALSDVEVAAVRVIIAYIYGDSYEECDNAVFALRDALKRIGAL